MANPRKFSEKIALHKQRQAEEEAAFKEIMREVSVATKVCIHLFLWNNSHLIILILIWFGLLKEK